MKYRKFWAALIGAAATSGLGIYGPDSPIGQTLTNEPA